MKPKQKAVFLDRDGVLNKAIIKNGKPYPPASLAELEITADALSALNQLKQEGFLLVGATNQPDVARGKTSKAVVESINAMLLNALPLDAIKICYHDDKDNCHCRKPLPGLLTTAAQEFNIDLTQSYMIGDRWKDIAAGKQAGCKTVWLDYQYQEPYLTDKPDYAAGTLTAAVAWITASTKG